MSMRMIRWSIEWFLVRVGCLVLDGVDCFLGGGSDYSLDFFLWWCEWDDKRTEKARGRA